MDAPRGSVDFEESDELQRLRRRAYGPNADIAGDAAAQARLSELEAAQRRERAPVVDGAAALPAPVSERVPVPEPLEGSRRPASTSIPQPVNGASAEHERAGGSVTEQDPAGVPIADSEPIDGALSAPWWRRRRLLPRVIAAVAVPAAAIGIGGFVVDESNRPKPVAQTIVTADYRFENSLADSVGAATELSAIGAHATGFIDEAVLGQARPVLTFDRGSGLELTPASMAIGSEYTIELVFRFDRLDGYAKILDFNNATEDSGLYSLDGRMDFWPITTGFRAAVEADSYAHVVLTRDATDKVVAYVNGARQLSFHDTGDIAVIDANDTLRLFSDDTATANEDSGGAVSRIRLYDGPLSASDVAALAAELPITAPTLADVEPFLR